MPDRIERASVVVSSPGRNFVTLVVETSDGVIGVGDGTLNGRELAVAAYLESHVIPILVGRDASRIEDTWQYLYRGGYWRRGPVTLSAIAAVDMALWDILGKRTGLPVYKLLGGASRDGLLAYAHAGGQTYDALAESIRAATTVGYRAVRVQAGVPGLGAVYGVSPSDSQNGSRYDYEPATAGGTPHEEVWDSEAYIRTIPDILAQVRSEFGKELLVLHDVHNRLRPIEAAKLAQRLEPYDLFWLEDCTPIENQEVLRMVRAKSVTPLAIGETSNTVWELRSLISEQLIDYIRASATHFGGITPLRKLMDFAAQFQIRSGFHGPSDVSPVGLAAELHLGLAINNFGIQELMGHTAETRHVFRQSMQFRDGLVHPGEEPGLGVTFDAEAAALFPYKRAYLPVNRLHDGTMHDW